MVLRELSNKQCRKSLKISSNLYIYFSAMEQNLTRLQDLISRANVKTTFSGGEVFSLQMAARYRTQFNWKTVTLFPICVWYYCADEYYSFNIGPLPFKLSISRYRKGHTNIARYSCIDMRRNRHEKHLAIQKETVLMTSSVDNLIFIFTGVSF